MSIAITFESDTHYIDGEPAMEVETCANYREALWRIQYKRRTGHRAGVFLGTIRPPLVGEDQLYAAPAESRVRAWSLACIYGHEWMHCSLLDVLAGGTRLRESWEKIEKEGRDTRIGGCVGPSLMHTTLTGRTSWVINDDHVIVTIRRPKDRTVIELLVPHDPQARVKVLKLDPEFVFVRHIEALTRVLDVLHGAYYAAEVADALINKGGIARPAYHDDAWKVAEERRKYQAEAEANMQYTLRRTAQAL